MSVSSGKRVGVVLSGCGYLDGSEVQEATLTLLFLDRAGATVSFFAPDVDQTDTVDHLTQNAVGELRNMRTEAARITRGKVADLVTAKASELDALVLPGGYGVAKSLCNFARRGSECLVAAHLSKLVFDMHLARKPMAFLCIAPVIAARVLGKFRPRLTVGHDKETVQALEDLGAVHVPATVDQIVVDEEHRLVSTPAYMLDARIAEVARGIEAAIARTLAMTA